MNKKFTTIKQANAKIMLKFTDTLVKLHLMDDQGEVRGYLLARSAWDEVKREIDYNLLQAFHERERR